MPSFSARLRHGELRTASRKAVQDFATPAEKLSLLLSAFGSARSHKGLTADEVLIFLAAGLPGSGAPDTVPATKPVTYIEISVLLKIPKETVRRKALRLIGNGLIKSTSEGLRISDLDSWHQVARSIFGCGD